MTNCKVMWNRSIDANAEKYDHGLIKMDMQFKIKAHRKITKSFNRDALKLEDNRDILDKEYMTAREEYNLLFPPLKSETLTAKSVVEQSNAERKIQKSISEKSLKQSTPQTVNAAPPDRKCVQEFVCAPVL